MSDPLLAPFDALIGTWDTEARHRLTDDEVIRGSAIDSHGVRRSYGMSLEDGVLRWWRNFPGFDQRSYAELGPDEFEVVNQLAERPGEWQDDLRATYRRRA